MWDQLDILKAKKKQHPNRKEIGRFELKLSALMVFTTGQLSRKQESK